MNTMYSVYTNLGSRLCTLERAVSADRRGAHGIACTPLPGAPRQRHSCTAPRRAPPCRMRAPRRACPIRVGGRLGRSALRSSGRGCACMGNAKLMRNGRPLSKDAPKDAIYFPNT
eukprot:5320543-Prymnesium_polylepis.1